MLWYSPSQHANGTFRLSAPPLWYCRLAIHTDGWFIISTARGPKETGCYFRHARNHGWVYVQTSGSLCLKTYSWKLKRPKQPLRDGRLGISLCLKTYSWKLKRPKQPLRDGRLGISQPKRWCSGARISGAGNSQFSPRTTDDTRLASHSVCRYSDQPCHYATVVAPHVRNVMQNWPVRYHRNFYRPAPSTSTAPAMKQKTWKKMMAKSWLRQRQSTRMKLRTR